MITSTPLRRFLLLCFFSGCQCLQPVSEEVDAGLTSDAGVAECVRAGDCVPRVAPRECGFGAGAPSRSCFDGRCVFDCEGTRTCSSAAASCLSCDGGSQCNSASCAFVNESATGRIYRSCTAGTSDTLGTFSVHYRQGATCNFQLFLADGGVFGALDLLGDFSTGSAQVTEEPGVTCSVRALATALNRVELGCAQCLYMLEWP